MKTHNELREMITSNTYIFDVEQSHIHAIYSTLHDDERNVNEQSIVTTIDVITIDDDDNMLYESFEYAQHDDELRCVFTTSKRETIFDVNNSIERSRIVRERATRDSLMNQIALYNTMRNA